MKCNLHHDTNVKANPMFIAALFGAGIASKPIPQITVSLINDQTGMNAQATIPANGAIFAISDLFANTRVDDVGCVFASSAQLIRFVDNVFCVFQVNHITIPINDKWTFINFDTARPSALVNLNEVTVQCEI